MKWFPFKIIFFYHGLFEWFHECGHIAYDDSEMGISDGVNQNNAMYLSLIFLALGQFWWAFTIPALVSVIMIMYYYLKEEWWCNDYAAKQLYKLKGGKK